MMDLRRVVVTGIGVVTALGKTDSGDAVIEAIGRFTSGTTTGGQLLDLGHSF